MNELTDEVYEQITEFCEEGNIYVERHMFDDAIQKYKLALDLIPEPITYWDASTWVYVAIGDTYYLMNEFQLAVNNLLESLKCPGGIGNPFIMLRIGQCFFELDDLERAKNYLLQAYMFEGYEIFADQDYKYFELIKNMV